MVSRMIGVSGWISPLWYVFFVPRCAFSKRHTNHLSFYITYASLKETSKQKVTLYETHNTHLLTYTGDTIVYVMVVPCPPDASSPGTNAKLTGKSAP